MALKDTGIRVGAAAFALGLALAGPQAAGVAAADRGGADGTSSATEDRGDARDLNDADDPHTASTAEAFDGTPAAADEADGASEDFDPQDFAPEESPIEVSIDKPDFSEEAGEEASEETSEEPEEPADVFEELPEDTPEKPFDPDGEFESVPDGEDTEDTEETGDEPGTEEPPVVVEGISPEASGDTKPLPETEDGVADESTEEPTEEPTDDAADEETGQPVLLPVRGGPDPLPWWRTTTTTGTDGTDPSEPEILEGAGTFDEPVYMYNLGPGVEPPKLVETGQVDVPNQGIDSLRTQLVAVIDQVIEWLNGLPGNFFTEFLSGALMLLRRALEPQTSEPTDDPGNSVSDPDADPKTDPDPDPDTDPDLDTDPDTDAPDGLIGLTEDEAAQAAAGAGWTTRIVSRDGEDFAITKDYRLDRVNFTVVNGVVTAVYVG